MAFGLRSVSQLYGHCDRYGNKHIRSNAVAPLKWNSLFPNQTSPKLCSMVKSLFRSIPW